VGLGEADVGAQGSQALRRVVQRVDAVVQEEGLALSLLLALDRPNTGVGTYPLVMIPVFAVPLSLMLHALSLRQLLRREGSLPPLRTKAA